MTFVTWENLFKLSSIKAQQPNFTNTMTWCGATTRAETFHGDYFVIISNLAMWNMKLWCDNNKNTKQQTMRCYARTKKERKWTISFSMMMIRRIVGEEEENLFFHLSSNAISLYLILSFKQPWKLNKWKVRDDEIRENISKRKMEHESRIKIMGFIKSLVLYIIAHIFW